MGVLIGITGMLGFAICLVLLLIRFIKKKPKKPMLIALLVCFVLIAVGIAMTPTPQEEISDNDLKVHFIDVGQADSIFIDFGDTDILIDGGNNNDGLEVVNYLRQLEVDDIEIMIGTHPHEDHIGGLDDVLNAFDVEIIIDSGTLYTTKTYESYIKAIEQEKNNGAKTLNDEDMIFDLGNNVVLKIIETVDESGDLNNDSVVAMLNYGDIEFLFTGDMEEDMELNYLEKFSDIDVLKVAHHGSSTSSSNEFLDKVKPEHAVISVGQDNKYGHPHPETLSKFKDRGINVYRTDEQGSIIATTDGENITFNASPINIDITSSH